MVDVEGITVEGITLKVYHPFLMLMAHGVVYSAVIERKITYAYVALRNMKAVLLHSWMIRNCFCVY